MVMPRSRSSRRRSGSMPVSAVMSVDFPWSTWPAVPMTRTVPSAVIRPAPCTARKAPAPPRGRAAACRRSRCRARSRWRGSAAGSGRASPLGSDALDLDPQPTRQRRDADRRARGPVVAELLRVDLVHGREVAHVGEEHGRLEHMREIRARRREDGREVVEDPRRLDLHVALDGLARRGVEPDLAGAEDEVAAPDGLAVRPDRLWRTVGRDLLKRHSVLPWPASARETAAASLPSSSGSTLRRSSATRSSTIRATTGGSAARSTAAARDAAGTSSAPAGEPGLRPAQELVAAERHDVRAFPHRLGDGLFLRQSVARRVEERAAAQVVDEDDPALARQGGELAALGPRHEAGQLEVARVHAEDRGGALRDRARVIARVRAVRGPDLDELRAGTPEDVGDAEAAADLHELAPRDDDLLARGECREREEHRRRIVVRHDRVLGAGEVREEPRGVAVALATLAQGEVVLHA